MHKEGVFIHPPHNSEIPQEHIDIPSPKDGRIPEKKEELLVRWGVEQYPKSVQDALFFTYALKKYGTFTQDAYDCRVQDIHNHEFLIRLLHGHLEPTDVLHLIEKCLDISHYAFFESSLEETEEEKQLRRIEDLTYYFSRSLKSHSKDLRERAGENEEILYFQEFDAIYYLCGVLCDTPYEQHARESLIAIWNEKFPPSLPDTESPKKVSRNPFFIRIMKGFFTFTSDHTVEPDFLKKIADGAPLEDCVSLLASLQRLRSSYLRYAPLLAHPLQGVDTDFLLKHDDLLRTVQYSQGGNTYFDSPWLLWKPRAQDPTNYDRIRRLLPSPMYPHLNDSLHNEYDLEVFKHVIDHGAFYKSVRFILLQLSTATLQLPNHQLPHQFRNDLCVLETTQRTFLHDRFLGIINKHLHNHSLLHITFRENTLRSYVESGEFDFRDTEAFANFTCHVLDTLEEIETAKDFENRVTRGLDLFHDICKKIRDDIPYRAGNSDIVLGFSHSSGIRGLDCLGSAKLLSFFWNIIADNIPNFKESHHAYLQWFSGHVRVVMNDGGKLYAYDHGKRSVADTDILQKTPLLRIKSSYALNFERKPQFDPQNPPPPFRRGPNPSYIPPGHTLLGQFMSPSERTPNITPPDFASHSQTLFAQSTEIVASALQYGVAVALEGLENAGLNPQLPKTPPSPSSSNSPSLRPSLRDPHSLHDHTPNIQESSSSLETSPAPSLSTTSQTLRRIAQGVGFILGTSAGYSVLSVLSRAPEGTAYVEAASLELTEVSAPEINMTIARNAFVLGADDVILNPDIVFVSHEQNTRVITLEGSQELTASPHLFSLLVSDNLSTLSSTHPTSPSFSDEKHISLHIHGDQLQALGVTAAFLESAVRDGYLDQHLSWQEIDLFINGIPTANAVRTDQKIVIHVRSDYKKSLVQKRNPLTPEKYKSLRLAPLQTKSAQRKISKTAQTLFASDK